MAVVLSAPRTTVRDGRRSTTIIATQDLTTVVADEFAIPIPEWATLTMVEAVLAGAGGAVTIQPAFGTIPAFVIGGDGYIDQAAAAALVHRIQDDRRIVGRPIGDAPPQLYVRTTPDANLILGQTIVTRITLVWGHDV